MDPVTLQHPPSGGNPYLEGNYAPVGAEQTVQRVLPVDGAIPPALQGTLFRNGPNPVQVPDPGQYHWFAGDGMVHAVELRDGQAVSYTNRWVRTRRLSAEIGTQVPKGPVEPINGPANTHIVWHAGRLLALVESGLPHLLSTDLDTLAVEDFDGMLASPMTAHPKPDPASGGLTFFGYDVFGPPFLRYHELDAAGAMIHSAEIDLPRATMQHDFGVTATKVAFFDLPVVFDMDLAVAGAPLPFAWQADAGARVGVLERGEDGDRIEWLLVDPCYVFHVMGAFDDGEAVVLDVCRYDRTFDTGQGGLLGSGTSRLERWRAEPGADRVSVTQVDDRAVDFPRIDDTLAGRPYRYGYCVEMARSDGADLPVALRRYDRARDESTAYDPGPGRYPGEPVFVRSPDGRADDEGWVLTVVYDAERDASDLVILDATSFSGRPEAVDPPAGPGALRLPRVLGTHRPLPLRRRRTRRTPLAAGPEGLGHRPGHLGVDRVVHGHVLGPVRDDHPDDREARSADGHRQCPLEGRHRVDVGRRHPEPGRHVDHVGHLGGAEQELEALGVDAGRLGQEREDPAAPVVHHHQRAALGYRPRCGPARTRRGGRPGPPPRPPPTRPGPPPPPAPSSTRRRSRWPPGWPASGAAAAARPRTTRGPARASRRP